MKSNDTQALKNPLETQSIGKLMLRFAVPAIISSLVNSIYNIVDQIFIGQSIGPLGNAATNVAFPLVIIVAAISMMIGVGGASNFSLNLGEGKKESAGRIVGQIVTAVVVLLYFRKFKSLKLRQSYFKLRWMEIKAIAALGAAAFFNQLAVTVVQIILNNTLGHYGELSVYGRDIPLACVGIVSKVNTIFISVIFGISHGRFSFFCL